MKNTLLVTFFLGALFNSYLMASEKVLLSKKMKSKYCSIITKKAKKMDLASYSKKNCLKWGDFYINEVYDPFEEGEVKKFEVGFADTEVKELGEFEQTLICDFELEKRNKKIKINYFFCDIDG